MQAPSCQAWLLLVILSCPAGVAELARIEISSAQPKAGEPFHLEIVQGSESSGEFRILIEEKPGTVFAKGYQPKRVGTQTFWSHTPSSAGLLRVEVRGHDGDLLARRDLHVARSEPPVAGLLVLLAAAFFLIGGVSVGIWRQMQQRSLPDSLDPPTI